MPQPRPKLQLPEPLDEHERSVQKGLFSIFEDMIDILTKGIRVEDNLDAADVSYTTNAVANTEDTVAHNLGRIPIGYWVISRDKAGVVYNGGTAWTTTNIYLKCNVASTAVRVIVF